MAVQLAQFANGWQWVVVFVYRPSPLLQEELWADILEVVENFRGVPLLFGMDFNDILETANRLNDSRDWDPGSEQF